MQNDQRVVTILDQENRCWWVNPGRRDYGGADLMMGGDESTRTVLEPAPRSGWWRAATEPRGEPLSWVLPERRPTIAWTRREGVVLDGFGETYTVEDWRELLEGIESGTVRDILESSYVGVHGPPERPVHPIERPEAMLELVGSLAPPVPEGATWVATPPAAIAQWPQLHHEIPGHLTGLAAHLTKLLDALPRVTAYNHDRQRPQEISVTVGASFDKPIMVWERTTRGGRKKVARHGVTHRFAIAAGPIEGHDLAEATEIWNQTIEEVLFQVEGATAVVCSHCRGFGAHVELAETGTETTTTIQDAE